ncbi:unnamed protein product [Mytilus edulis]|uniref:Uncharacterized protein n=1 Tax=Mytilus edulis TaxID=6550 RepID=A0A8S3SAS4_MYTED|nr:unnamed protein product [Mytilus edulis]
MISSYHLQHTLKYNNTAKRLNADWMIEQNEMDIQTNVCDFLGKSLNKMISFGAQPITFSIIGNDINQPSSTYSEIQQIFKEAECRLDVIMDSQDRIIKCLYNKSAQIEQNEMDIQTNVCDFLGKSLNKMISFGAQPITFSIIGNDIQLPSSTYSEIQQYCKEAECRLDVIMDSQDRIIKCLYNKSAQIEQNEMDVQTNVCDFLGKSLNKTISFGAQPITFALIGLQSTSYEINKYSKRLNADWMIEQNEMDIQTNVCDFLGKSLNKMISFGAQPITFSIIGNDIQLPSSTYSEIQQYCKEAECRLDGNYHLQHTLKYNNTAKRLNADWMIEQNEMDFETNVCDFLGKSLNKTISFGAQPITFSLIGLQSTSYEIQQIFKEAECRLDGK